MNSNPYESPQDTQPGRSNSQIAKGFLAPPAIALMVVSAISAGLLAIAIPFDFYLLFAQIDPNDTATLLFRMVWSVVILVASIWTFYGAWCMYRLKHYETARLGAIIACIPCVGPCCLLGIPFGIWALSVLKQPGIQGSFES